MTNEQINHKVVIDQFLDFLYKNQPHQPFILKGGTSLMRCYKLDRFSEDIDLDCCVNNSSIFRIIENFCKKYDYEFRIAKDSDTTKRCMIHYPNEYHPLKVEVSYRKKEIDEYLDINNTLVYTIENLFIQKLGAYMQRDKLRDLYDVTFIYHNFELNENLLQTAKEFIGFKGLEQVEYLTKADEDSLVDHAKLTDDFLSMYNGLGLLDNSKKHEEETVGD